VEEAAESDTWENVEEEERDGGFAQGFGLVGVG
jgi:hypothetical protein